MMRMLLPMLIAWLTLVSPVVVKGNQIIRAIRDFAEDHPNCVPHVQAVRDVIDAEFAAHGYGPTRRQLGNGNGNNGNGYGNGNSKNGYYCPKFCNQFSGMGPLKLQYCHAYSEGNCGTAGRRELKKTARRLDEDYQECVAKQYIMLDAFLNAAMTVQMDVVCMEFFLGPWETACFDSDAAV